MTHKLYELRERRGYTQGTLAKQSGICQPGVSKLESVFPDITLRSLRKYAKGLGGVLRVSIVIGEDEYKLEV